MRITVEDVRAALDGTRPAREGGHSYRELAKEIGYSPSYIANIIAGRKEITESFAGAFHDWRVGEEQRIRGFHTLQIGGIPIEDLVEEAGMVQKVGEGPPGRIVVFAQGWTGTISVNGLVEAVYTTLEKRTCAYERCDVVFYPNSHNHIYHVPACRKAQYKLNRHRREHERDR